jgi:hypothetical protein
MEHRFCVPGNAWSDVARESGDAPRCACRAVRSKFRIPARFHSENAGIPKNRSKNQEWTKVIQDLDYDRAHLVYTEELSAMDSQIWVPAARPTLRHWF